MEESDRSLIERAKKGDDEAFDAFTKQYLPAVYSFCVRFMGSREDAEDVTQETFVKAWRALARFDTKRAAKPWLFQIAKNTATDHMRKRRAVSFSDIAIKKNEIEFSDSIEDTEPLPDSVFESTHLGSEVQKALGTLPARDRLLLTLRYEHGFPFEEIGQILKAPANTVRSLHRRALARLRELLAHHAPNQP